MYKIKHLAEGLLASSPRFCGCGGVHFFIFYFFSIYSIHTFMLHNQKLHQSRICFSVTGLTVWRIISCVIWLVPPHLDSPCHTISHSPVWRRTCFGCHHSPRKQTVCIPLIGRGSTRAENSLNRPLLTSAPGSDLLLKEHKNQMRKQL